jgi:DNA invertase Pin-like site-specific DNA recombinase
MSNPNQEGRVMAGSSITTSAIAYYRMSTDRQEASIPQQREAVEAYARQHGYHILREYRDEGVSGDANEKRLGFQKLIQDAQEKKDFAAVLCWDLSRFSRNDPFELAFWTRPLRQAGVQVVTVCEGPQDWDSMAGRIVYTVQQEGKHAYLRDMARNVARGKLAKAKQGLWSSSSPPYGYRSVAHPGVPNGRMLQPDPQTAPIVRRVFQRYAARLASTRSLAIELNAENIRPPRGPHWRPWAIACMLTNPAYKGDLVQGRHRAGKYFTGRGGEVADSRRAPDALGAVVSGAHEAIVDKALWELAQQVLQENRERRAPKRNRHTYVFSGLVRCGKCGAPMTGTLSGPATGYAPAYGCSRYQQLGSKECTGYQITEQRLLRGVSRAVERFLSQVQAEDLHDEVRQALRANEADQPEENLDQIREQAAELNRKVQEASRRVLEAPSQLVKHLMTELARLNDEQEALRSRIERAEQQAGMRPEQLDGLVDAFVGALRRLVDLLAGSDPHQSQAAFREAVRRITLHSRTTRAPGQKRLHHQLTQGEIEVRLGGLTSSSHGSTTWFVEAK